MLCGAILPKHWERFQVYAERIRIISSYPTESDSVHPSVWLFLAARCRGAPLIPRLRELEAYYLTLSETPPLALLLSPALRVLNLRFALETADTDRLHATSHVASSLLQNLPFMAPNIENLTVRADFDLGLKSLQSVECFTQLQLLFTPSTLALDEHMLQVLSTIPALQDLSCWIDLSSSSTTAFGPHVFHQLTKLTVTGPSEYLVTVFLACQFPNLMCINIHIIQRADELHPQHLFTALSCNPTLLTSLEITFSHELASRLRSLIRFQPLLALPNITSFHLIFVHTELSLCDGDLTQFGTAWPQLATFKIEHRTRKYSQPELVRPTLSGIIDLARRCPSLATLHIPEMDARAIPELDAVPALGHGLRIASIINIFSPISLEVYLEVATVLDRVFPVIDLDEVWQRRLPLGKGWMEVVSFLKAMRVGRANGEAYVDPGRQG